MSAPGGETSAPPETVDRAASDHRPVAVDQPRTENPEVLTVAELSSLLRIGRRQCYELVRSGQVPGVLKIHNRIRISRLAVAEWLHNGATGHRQAAARREEELLAEVRPFVEQLEKIAVEAVELVSTVEAWLHGATGHRDEELTGASPTDQVGGGPPWKAPPES